LSIYILAISGKKIFIACLRPYSASRINGVGGDFSLDKQEEYIDISSVK